MGTKVLTAHIPDELADKVDRYAKSMDRSATWIVNRALAEWVDWEERKRDLTLEALAAVDRDEAVEDEAVARWIESLDTDQPLAAPAPRQ